jgi:predicted transcriptional regulator
MSRSASRARAAEAYTMHLDGYSWADIASELGFGSRQGAQTAVTRHLAETAGDHQAVAQLSAAIDRIDDQLAEASGYYAAQNVNVLSATTLQSS